MEDNEGKTVPFTYRQFSVFMGIWLNIDYLCNQWSCSHNVFSHFLALVLFAVIIDGLFTRLCKLVLKTVQPLLQRLKRGLAARCWEAPTLCLGIPLIRNMLVFPAPLGTDFFVFFLYLLGCCCKALLLIDLYLLQRLNTASSYLRWMKFWCPNAHLDLKKKNSY